MQVTITSVANSQWANAEHTAIDCSVTTARYGNHVLPFTADQNDSEEHGRALFAAIQAGDYGSIAEYVPPPEPVIPTPEEQPSVEGAQTL